MAHLAQKLYREFDNGARRRGEQYYWQNRVKVLAGAPDYVEARVRGSRLYDVSFRWNDGVLSALCECDYFDSVGACKHLWAVMLAAEARGHLQEAAHSAKFAFETWDDEVPDPDEEDDDRPGRRLHAVSPPQPPPRPTWAKRLEALADFHKQAAMSETAAWPAKREIVYVIDCQASVSTGGLVVTVHSRDLKKDGTYSRLAPCAVKHQMISRLPLAEDRALVATLTGSSQYSGWSYMNQSSAGYRIAHPLSDALVPEMCRTGRCYLRRGHVPEELESLAWDEGDPWTLALELRKEADKTQHGKLVLAAVLRRGEERMEASAPALVLAGGLVFHGGLAARLAAGVEFQWLAHFRQTGNIQASGKDQDELLAALFAAPRLPPLEVPEELRFEDVTVAPRPGLKIAAPDAAAHQGKLRAELWFDYAGHAIAESEQAHGRYDAAVRRYVRRDLAAERAAVDMLGSLELKPRPAGYYQPKPAWEMAPTKLPRVVKALLEHGWHIEAEGKTFRRPGGFQLGVSAGIDWFELHGDVDYGDLKATLPQLLEALRRGENMVRLSDGTYGMLPEDWLRKIGPLAGMGAPEDGHIRFRRAQAGLLDALLASQPEATCDATFARIRDELNRFQGVEAAPQPPGFVGHLRDYQREGLGWLEFLRRYSLGGCLADDIGVGKTAQVLALLENRRAARAGGDPAGPSLVVVPKSLIFNWKQEAARFAPALQVLDYTGVTRASSDLMKWDLILTTYGTLRRDAVRLKDVEFDYIVLDEAQAIKNASSEGAKAVRLLRGNHRLAVSGTPIENHLGELWSLFEFLNPGMLGTANVFRLAGGSARNPAPETRALLAHALRPFILRRTKEQVAKELPARTEQTVYCEMETVQRRLYDELREHYRNKLLGRIAENGLAKSKMQILEALLRLRQAACHPGLIDSKRRGEPSAKLDMLFEQIEEVIESGHKALVFSQFTSLLSIVREQLDERGIVYEYLDGATTDRQACVTRFQSDAACPLFLISLKAGGLGLNLTAAGYVFLLDPWWNPAVEAQAVDRAHRIGQTKHVFAYRLIARDTVEEKVLELQKTKRDLAAAIIGEDNSLIRDLKREDLELLLS